jgi:ABC-type methionine transport system ATPase subunit
MGMGKRRVHLTFQGQLADEPAIWTVSQEFGLVFNIRQADLEEGIGWIMLELEGDDQKLADALQWLEKRGVIVAPIEQDVVAG